MRMKTAQQEGKQSVAIAQASPVTVADRPRNGAALLLDLQRKHGNRYDHNLESFLSCREIQKSIS
jgi:hypothetical protein